MTGEVPCNKMDGGQHELPGILVPAVTAQLQLDGLSHELHQALVWPAPRVLRFEHRPTDTLEEALAIGVWDEVSGALLLRFVMSAEIEHAL